MRELRGARRRREFVRWTQRRPPIVQALMWDWPPLAVVKTRPGIILLIPAPGTEGTIQSYFEDGSLGVAAPMTIPHPEHGWGLGHPGMIVKAKVKPEQLKLIREGEWTRADVRAALEQT